MEPLVKYDSQNVKQGSVEKGTKGDEKEGKVS